jgi:hypothetical protein
MTVQIDRRRLLSVLLGTGAAAVVSSLVSPVTPMAPPLPPQAALLGVLSELDGARSIGIEYLEQFPSEASASQLLTMIVQHRPHVLRTSMTEAEARIFLQRAVRQDFHHGHTVELNGWVVSQTEARLCALAAMAKQQALSIWL